MKYTETISASRAYTQAETNIRVGTWKVGWDTENLVYRVVGCSGANDGHFQDTTARAGVRSSSSRQVRRALTPARPFILT